MKNKMQFERRQFNLKKKERVERHPLRRSSVSMLTHPSQARPTTLQICLKQNPTPTFFLCRLSAPKKCLFLGAASIPSAERIRVWIRCEFCQLYCLKLAYPAHPHCYARLTDWQLHARARAHTYTLWFITQTFIFIQVNLDSEGQIING